MSVSAADIKRLADPTPPAEVKQRKAPGGGSKMLSYIDARYVFERLDEVCGAENWVNQFERDTKGALRCGIGILVDRGEDKAEWVFKWDTGTESTIESQKGEHSDSIKRAAVLWGIARDLYDERVAPFAGAGAGTSVPSTPEMTSSWRCPAHGTYKVVPAGRSKATGKPYAAFVACDSRGCDQKPPRGTPPPAPRVPQVHEFSDDFGNDEDF